MRGNYQKSMRGLQSISKLQFNESRATAFLGNKITIYKGKKSIDGVTFHISIFIEGNKYLIVTERGRTQQRIQMLVDDYNVLLRDYLQGIHTGIFDLLQVN